MAFLSLRVENVLGDIVMVNVGQRGGWKSWSSIFELEAKLM